MIATAAAATLSTLVQVVLWLLFTDAWPDILFRDARLAAAIVMGTEVLPPPATFDAEVMAVASVVHAVLSLAYTAPLVLLIERRRGAGAALVGAVFGLALYVVNMYGFTAMLPWFAAARDWITAVAHVAFGVSAALAYRAARPAIA